MEKILVTGGAGYIGSTLVPLLLAKGYKVKVLDNLIYGSDPLLPCFSYSNFELVVGDIRDYSIVRESLQGIDIIIHLAAIVGFPACKKAPDLAQSVNVEGTKIIDEERSKSQLIFYASTGSNYGDLECEICTEETPLNPLTEYGISKTTAEKHLLETGNIIAYRFATAFGVSPRLRLDLLINDFVYQALKNKNLIVYEKQFMRTFIDVSDIARSFIFGIDNADKMMDNIYNVGDESMNYSKEQICIEIKKKIDYYLHFADFGEDLDKRNYYVSYDKINKLGFITEVTLQEGLDRLIKALSVVSIYNKYSNV